MMWSMMVSPASSPASVMAPNAGGPVAHKFLVSTVGVKNTLQDEEDIHGAPQPVALARMQSNAVEPDLGAREWENNHCESGLGSIFQGALFGVRGVEIAETCCALVDRAKCWSQ